ERGHGVDGALVEKALAVPKHVAGRRLHQQGALADGEAGDGADAGEAGLLLAQVVLVALRRHLLERGPLLAPPADVLALVLADRAGGRRRVAGGDLAAAGPADVRRHRSLPSRCDAARDHAPAPRVPSLPDGPGLAGAAVVEQASLQVLHDGGELAAICLLQIGRER